MYDLRAARGGVFNGCPLEDGVCLIPMGVPLNVCKGRPIGMAVVVAQWSGRGEKAHLPFCPIPV